MLPPLSRVRRCMPLFTCVRVAFAWTACVSATCAWTAMTPAIASAHGCLAATLADEFTADRLGMVREWIIQIPSMAPGRTLENVSSGDGLVVAQTSDGLVHAILATPPGGPTAAGTPLPGSLLWSQPVGRPGGRFEQAGIGTDLLVVSQDKTVYGLERATGLERWRETDKKLAATGAVAIGDWVYSPNGNGMTRFAVRPLRQAVGADAASPAADAARPAGSSPPAAKAAAKKGKAKKKRQESLLPSDVQTGGVVAYPPVPLREGVLWCTTDGLLVTLQPTDVEWQRQDFSLENPPAGPPTVRDRSIFAATTNGDLARIDLVQITLPVKKKKLEKLRLVWHAVLPGPAESGCFVAGDTVVVSLGDLGIAAYSAETGAESWRSCVPGTILSVGGDRVWLIDRVGRLSSLDLADGMRRETLCLGPFTLPLVNLQDDRLLLASPSGTIVSLAPRRAATVPPAPGDGDAAKEPEAEAEADAEPMPAEEAMDEATEGMAEPDANQ